MQSVPLHDIGMVTVPSSVLRKPGPLTGEELDLVRRHTTLGCEAIDRSQQRLAVDAGFLRCAKDIVLSHHERFDGSGYPQGLRGDAIPLGARLMAVADAYDAIVTRRPYRAAGSHDDAVATIFASSGTQFDPVVVAAFEQRRDDFRAIAERYADDPS